MTWIFSILFAAVAAVACGLGLFALDQIGFYLIIIMPIVAGSIIGFMTYLPTVRKPVATAPLVITALLAGALCVSIYWAATYMDYQNEIVALIQERDSRITRGEALEFIEEVNQEEYGVTGFQAFLTDAAETGFSINRAASSSSGVDIQGNLAYGFWILEALLIVGMAVFTVMGREGNNFVKRFRTDDTMDMDNALATLKRE